MIDNAKDNFAKFLKIALDDYHQRNPQDKISDWQILEDLMEYLVKAGTIKKKHGKYLIPTIDDPEKLFRMMRSDNN